MKRFGYPTPVGRDDPRLSNFLIADPEARGVREFIRRELLHGTIRTSPAGRGLVMILPTSRRAGIEDDRRFP